MRKEKQSILLLDLASGSRITSSLGHIEFRAASPLDISRNRPVAYACHYNRALSMQLLEFRQ